MTSLQVNYFLKVAESMSFSRAAEELYVSQPSVSRQVQLLEQGLGFSLFDRSSKRNLTLTPAGVVFREYFLHTARGLEEVKKTAAALSGSEHLKLRVGIGVGWDFSRQLMEFRREALRRYPMAELYFESDTFRKLQSRVQSGNLDVVLCTETSVQLYDNLDVQLVNRIRGRAFVRKGLLAPEGTPLTIEDFDGQNLLMLPKEEETPVTLQLVMLQFLDKGCKPVPVTLPNRDSIYQAVLRGEGFAVFDEHMSIAMDNRITSMPLDGKITLSMVWDRRNQNPLLRLFGELMSQPMEDGEE